MHILFTRFPLESVLGGAEIQTLSLMEGLIARGHAVSFAGSCPILLKECARRGIPVHRCDIGEPPVTKSGAISFLWRRKKMRAQLGALMGEMEPPDAVCMLSLSEKLLLTEFPIPNPQSPIPIFWIEHDPIGRWLTMNPWLPRLRALSKRATTIAVSTISREHYLHLGWDHDRTIAIPNGIDLGRLGPPFPRKRTAADEPLRLGCIARLSPEKGVDLLLAAMRNLPAHVTLAIAGTGRQEGLLRRLARAYDIEDRITFLLPESDIRSLYEQFDAFVLSSRTHDPFGLTAAEAMALGLPVIVTDACGIVGSLGGTEALVVPAGSTEALETGIRHLLEPATFNRLAANGPPLAREKFSLESMVQSYEDVFTRTPASPSP
jgi:glycosyltransferase involved in cell wall biosynthesis